MRFGETFIEFSFKLLKNLICYFYAKKKKKKTRLRVCSSCLVCSKNAKLDGVRVSNFYLFCNTEWN